MKRIVLEETQGDRKGMLHIYGVIEDAEVTELPALVDPIEVLGRVTAASLIQSKARYVLYREVLKGDAE